MKQRVKAYAKINLSLNVYQSENGYHALDSVVTTIDLYDTITVSKRKDDKMNVVMRGIGEEFLYGENNNAYKAAKLFQQTFATKGADITVIKNIPISGGLGGSSADVAGVLKALKKLYAVEEDVKPLADKLGSDSGYLLTGGFARLIISPSIIAFTNKSLLEGLIWLGLLSYSLKQSAVFIPLSE